MAPGTYVIFLLDVKPLDISEFLKRKWHMMGQLTKLKLGWLQSALHKERVSIFWYVLSCYQNNHNSCFHVLIALAPIHKLEVYQMDGKIAFLNGDLEEKIYIDQSEGFLAPRQERKVCKLNWISL